MNGIRSVLLAAVLASPLALLGACTGEEGSELLCSSSDFNAQTGTVGDFGTSAAAAKVEAFLHATGSLVVEVGDIEDRLTTACTNIATDLGVPASELQPENPNVPGARVQAACSRAAEEIQATIEQNVPSEVTLTLVFTPAVCAVSLDVYANCVAECEVDVSGNIDVQCEPGHLTGECTATCMGTCHGQCDGGCTGTCGGTCSGSCSGTCIGTCNGTETSGSCAGECVGTCQGNCTGSCDVSCSGECSGSCEGECTGECSVDFEAPRCDGEVNVEASAECEAACEADAQFDVDCTEPEVAVALTADVSGGAQAKLETLFATLETNLPAILEISTTGAARLQASAEAFADTLDGVGAVIDAGARAAACTVVAAGAALDAAASVKVSVEVSVEVSASVGAEGMAAAGS